MTGLEYYEKRCPHGRGQMVGRTVIAPDGRAGVIVDSAWDRDGALVLRLRPPGKPAPELRRADGSEPQPSRPGGRFRLFSAVELDNAIEINAEHCWKAPAADCRMPKRQPVWS